MSAYPYLLLSLTGLAVTLILMWGCRGQRRLMLLAGLLWAPTGFLGVIFNPVYWNPTLLFQGKVGVEDLIFSFWSASLCWLIAAGAAPLEGPKLRARAVLARSLLVLLVFMTAFVLSKFAVKGVMTAAMLAAFPVAGLMACFRPDAMRLVMRGALGYPAIYLSSIALTVWVFPEFGGQWRVQGHWGVAASGIPLEEAVWALLYGALSPWITAYVFDVYHL